MTIFEAKTKLADAQDALSQASKDWNEAVIEFLRKEFPDPVTMKYGKKERRGVLQAIKASNYSNCAEIRFVPYKTDGTLSKNSVAWPSISTWQINRAKSDEDLKRMIKEEMCLEP